MDESLQVRLPTCWCHPNPRPQSSRQQFEWARTSFYLLIFWFLYYAQQSCRRAEISAL